MTAACCGGLAATGIARTATHLWLLTRGFVLGAAACLATIKVRTDVEPREIELMRTTSAMEKRADEAAANAKAVRELAPYCLVSASQALCCLL